MPTILTAASVPTTILNQPSSQARGRHRSTGHPLYAVDPIEKSWQMGQPALGEMSYRQPTITWSDITAEDVHAQHGTEFQKPYLTKNPDGTYQLRYGQCSHEACVQQVQAITDSQRGMPQRRDRSLNPFRTYNSTAGDPPIESTNARKSGAVTLSLDWNVVQDSFTTLADTIPDDTGMNPYILPDPETTDQINWEKSARYSGPTTTYRRKFDWTRGKDTVVIDRWGRLTADVVISSTTGLPLPEEHADRLPSARCWYAMALNDSPETVSESDLNFSHMEVAFVFETPSKLDYVKEVLWYKERIIDANHGVYPSYEDQRQMAYDAAQARLERKAMRMRAPISMEVDTDPFRYTMLDLDVHEPHERIDIPDEMIAQWALTTRPEWNLAYYQNMIPWEQMDNRERLMTTAGVIANYTDEDITELEEEIIADLRERGQLHTVTLYAVRNHPNHLVAQQARMHSNGAEFLAHHEDAINGYYQPAVPVALEATVYAVTAPHYGPGY